MFCELLSHYMYMAR